MAVAEFFLFPILRAGFDLPVIKPVTSDAARRETFRALGFTRSKAFDWDDTARRYQALFDTIG